MKKSEVRARKLKELEAENLFSSLLSNSERKHLDNLSQGASLASDSQFIEAASITADTHDVADDLDYKEFMSSLLDPVTGTVRDFRIDDRKLPAAINYYDFCFNIIGKDAHPPWSRQYWAAAMLLGEICPYCSNKKYLDIFNIPKDFPTIDLKHKKRLVILENGVCPVCGRTHYGLVHSGALNPYNQGVYIFGQRSGKSSTAASIAAYTLHRYLKYPMLAELSPYMQKSTQLTGIFCSLTFKKAVEVLWTPFKNIVDGSTWFQEYFDLLEQYRIKTGNKLLLNSATKLAVGNKKLFCFPTGPTASTLRGNTSFMTFLDELGLFPPGTNEDVDDDVNRRASPDEAYTSLLNSLATVTSAIDKLKEAGYHSAPPAFMLSVSSPISNRDKVMRLLKQSQTDNSVFALQLPTWEVNPTLERNSNLIASAFKANYTRALRDFGAQPTDTSMAFFDAKIVSKLFNGAPPTHQLIQRSDEYEAWGELKQTSSIPYPSIMSLDAGYTNNSFSVSVLYYDPVKNKTIVACALECMPIKGRVINFTKMYANVILPLAKQLNVCYVVADRWNSIDLLHRLREDMGLATNKKPFTRADFYTLKRSDFEAAKASIANKTVVFPFLSALDIERVLSSSVEDYRTEFMAKPIQHLLLQFSTVVDAGPALCPDKAQGLTDDILRTVILGITKIHSEKISSRLSEFNQYIRSETKISMPMPIVVGRSSFF